MRHFLLPVFLVLASCQFGSSEREVEFLPDVPAEDLQLAGAEEVRTENASGESPDPQAKIGRWQGEVSPSDDGSNLAMRLEEEAQKRAASEELAAKALAAQKQAESELLAAQAAWIHERNQREELVQEREFLLQRIHEFDSLFDSFLIFEENNDQLRERVSNLELELYEARVYKPSLGDLSLEDAMRATKIALDRVAASVESVETLDEESGIGLRILNQFLFASGQTELGIKGVAMLQDLAKELQPLMDAGGTLQIVGHTDSEPLAAQSHRFPLGNFQLSCMRALEVANALVEAGIPPERVQVSGVGPWQPIDSNETEAGRSRNRRVELLVEMPDNPVMSDLPDPAPVESPK